MCLAVLVWLTAKDMPLLTMILLVTVLVASFIANVIKTFDSWLLYFQVLIVMNVQVLVDVGILLYLMITDN